MHVTSITALRALYDPVRERSAKKEIPELDAHARRLIGLSPLVIISSGRGGQGGGLDASPRGGEVGFVHVVDARTVWLPDAPGNNRLDTLENIAAGGAAGAPVGLLFLVPGMDETLRVNGVAHLSTNPTALRTCADARRMPKLVIEVTVQTVYLHCGKALMRADLWNPQRHIDRSTLPSMAEMMRDQIRTYRAEEIVAETEQQMRERYRQSL